MEQRPFASTGRKVGILGLGVFKIGRNQMTKYPGEPYPLPSDDRVRELLDTALELGINLLDTAPAYGSSEERLGKILDRSRDRFFLVTKAGEEFDGRSRWDFSADHIERSVQRSLRRLKTDRLDCVLLHCPKNDLEVLTTTPALEVLTKLKAQGQLLTFGASTHTVEGGCYAVERADAVMVTLHKSASGERPVIDLAKKLGKAVLIKKGLNSGHLASEEKELQSSLAHVVGTPGITSLVVGTADPAHLRQDARIVMACAKS